MDGMTAAYEIRTYEKGDYWHACLRVCLGKDTCIDMHARVSMSALARVLNKTFAGTFNVGADGREQVAGFFGKLWKGVKKVAKKVAKSKVFKVAKGVFRSPIFKAIAAGIPGVNVAVGALTAADMAMSAARSVYKKGKRGFALARRIKRVAMSQARRRRVPKATFQRAWRSGLNAVPSPKELAILRKYSGYARRMYNRAAPRARRRVQRGVPSYFRQFQRTAFA